jgi:hypothetical protein
VGGREGEGEREIEIGTVKRAGAPRDRESHLEWGTKSQDPQETRDEGWARSLKDDINTETAVMDRTHGPLGLQRLPDLTVCK